MAEFDAIRCAGDQNDNGIVGEVRLAVRMPPVGKPPRSLSSGWRERRAEVVLSVAELNEWGMQRALRGRLIDVAPMASHTLWPDAVTTPHYREKIVVAIPCEHPLAEPYTRGMNDAPDFSLTDCDVPLERVHAPWIGVRRQL